MIIRNYGFNRFNFSKDSFLFHAIRSLFVSEQVKGLIDKEEFLGLVDYLDTLQSSHQDIKEDILHMVHSRINLLFLAVIQGHSDCFRKTIKAFGYQQFLYPEGFDPLFFALENKNSSILEEFVEYFEENQGSIDRVLYSQEFIIMSLGCSSNRFRLFIANSTFVVPAPSSFELSLPDQLLTNRRDFYEVIPCTTFRNK